MDLKSYIRSIPDFPKPGILFYDITTLLQSAEAFGHVIDTLVDRYKDQEIDVIAGIESRGFIFGAPLAYELKIPFVPVRKVGKLPHETFSKEYELEYGTNIIECHKDAFNPGDKVLIVDDLIATGGTARATADLIEDCGALVHELVCIIELSFLPWKDKMGNHNVYSLIQYSE